MRALRGTSLRSILRARWLAESKDECCHLELQKPREGRGPVEMTPKMPSPKPWTSLKVSEK